MEHPDGRIESIDANVCTGVARVQRVWQSWQGPTRTYGVSSEYHLQLSLLPHGADPMGCFPDDWGPRRFEPMGKLFLIPARRAVQTRSDCRNQSSIVCKFDPKTLEAWFEQDMRWTSRRLQGSLDIASDNVRRLLVQMGDELNRPSFASETMIELLAAQAAIELSRYFLDIEDERAVGGLAPWQLKVLEERLKDATDAPSLGELAGLCRLSVRHLTRAFRISRGRSIGSYIADHRIDRAQQLIASGMGVKAVASEMGFKAASNFTAAFRRVTGETPRQYRQRVSRGRAVALAARPQIH